MTTSNVEHVVVLVLENRSFDSVLGWLYESTMPALTIPLAPPDDQFRGLDDACSKEQNVDIDHARPLRQGEGAIAAQSEFDALQPRQELSRKCIGGDLYDHIDEPGLAAEVLRLGFI